MKSVQVYMYIYVYIIWIKMEINNVYHLDYYYNYGKTIIYHLYNVQVEVLKTSKWSELLASLTPPD